MRYALKRFGEEPSFFDAIRPDDKGRFANIGFHGSYLSHLAVLGEGGPVLILEDDCAFYPGANCFYAPECDIFYGSHADDADEMIGAHCMGFSAKAAELAASYLSGLLCGDIGPDPRALREGVCDPAILPPIDGAYVWFRRAHPELSTAFAEISYQRSSRSDCTPGRLDSIPVVRQILGIGRALVR
jgi:glycosyl transferase family 25